MLVLLVANSANLFSYLYQFVMGRYLSVEDFGVLTSVNSLGIMAGAFLGVIPYIVSKYIIETKKNPDLTTMFLWKTFFFILYFMLGVSFGVVVFIDYICEYLNITDPLPIYIFLMYLVTGVLISVFFGVMQGLLMYVKVSIKGALVALLKLLFGIIIVVFLGYSYNGALVASLLANVIIGIWVYRIVIQYIPFRQIRDLSFPKGTYKNLASYSVPVALTWLAIGLITNIDVVLVKHYTSEFEAGEYSASAILSRIAVFLPGVLLSVLFPQVSQNNVDGKSSIGPLFTVLGLTVVLSIGFSVSVYFLSETLIGILFGVRYVGASDELVIITFAMSLVAVISVLFNFLLAKHLFSYLYITYALIVFFGFLIVTRMHSSTMEIATAVLYACASILFAIILLLAYYVLQERKAKNFV